MYQSIGFGEKLGGGGNSERVFFWGGAAVFFKDRPWTGFLLKKENVVPDEKWLELDIQL